MCFLPYTQGCVGRDPKYQPDQVGSGRRDTGNEALNRQPGRDCREDQEGLTHLQKAPAQQIAKLKITGCVTACFRFYHLLCVILVTFLKLQMKIRKQPRIVAHAYKSQHEGNRCRRTQVQNQCEGLNETLILKDKGPGGAVQQESTCLACTSPWIHPRHQEINQTTKQGGYLEVSEVILEIK